MIEHRLQSFMTVYALSSDDLVLHNFAQVHEIGAVSGYPYNQIACISGLCSGRRSGFPCLLR